MSITTINPATEKPIATYEFMSEAEVAKIIDLTHSDFLIWSKKTFSERAERFIKLADLLLENKNKYAELIAIEMGKPLKAGVAEIEKCALACKHFAENAEVYLQSRPVKTEMTKSYVTYRPLGIVFAIMPWNFPFWQVLRFAVPALMAGNGAVLKHAPITTGCALKIEQLFQNAGFPPNLFRSLIVENSLTANILENRKIGASTLTGSTQTGKIVGALAAHSLKKIVLELGGNDPYIILEDADLELAATSILASRLGNSGQACNAAKRILAVQKIREEFQKILLEKIQDYKMGNPFDENFNLGPLARKDLRENLHHQIEESVRMGAKALIGGFIPDMPGFYYPPTVLVNVKKGMPAYTEELFGPVLSFIDVQNEQEAIEIANDTPFGLAAGIFTRNTEHAEKIALIELNTGTVFINHYVRSDPRLPFGGVKDSGFGRELSAEGIHEFVNIKTIAIQNT